MSRIIITERGRKLQNEMLKEQFSLNFLPTPKSYLESSNRLDQSHSRSLSKIRTLSGNRGEQSKSSQSNHKFSIINNEDDINISNPHRHSISICPRRKDNVLDHSLDNPYIKKRINQLIRHFQKELPDKRINLKALINGTGGMNSHDTSVLNVLSMSPPPLNNLLSSYEYDQINPKIGSKNDQYMVQHHSRLLHIESSIEKMLGRYKFNKSKMEDFESKVQLVYEKKKKDVNNNNNKAPLLINDIKEQNAEAIEILARKTNAPLRHKKYIVEKIKKDYQPFWDNVESRASKQFISSSWQK